MILIRCLIEKGTSGDCVRTSHAGTDRFAGAIVQFTKHLRRKIQGPDMKRGVIRGAGWLQLLAGLPGSMCI